MVFIYFEKSIGTFFLTIKRKFFFDREGKLKKWGEKKFSLEREKFFGPLFAQNVPLKKNISYKKKIVVGFYSS
ncbi:MAG: hypothetical protein IKJ98_05305 [Bacteroidales bacterium]|nr:hypothetical protein [Bacteroidales bacterium]